MRPIQDVGSEILTNNPRPFYIFGGTEYGIKCRYLSILQAYYHNEYVEINSVSDIINTMSTKHIIPLKPTLYVCRYDESFVSALNESLASKIKSLKIIGTVVCLYEAEKHITKLDKYLPDYVVRIDSVSLQHMIRYLHSDFPGLPDKLIEIAATSAKNYGDAQNMCRCMRTIPPEELFSLSDVQVMQLFGKSTQTSEDDIKLGIASRNLSHLLRLLDNYSELDNIYYTILSTMVELDKITSNTYASSPLREYAKRWTKEDIYNLFMLTYEELKKSRTYSTNTYNSLLYLFSMLKFQTVPSVEAMEDPS